MKALSLWQPWASLIVWTDSKKHETRSWPCPKTVIGKEIAIHATAALPVEARLAVAESEDLYRLLRRTSLIRLGSGLDDLPRGAVLGVARVLECRRTEDAGLLYHVSQDDLTASDWSPGRFAWRLEVTDVFPEPVPAKGAQGLWEWRA